jgi:hypothetical protein
MERKIIIMQKGDIYADIYDSPETIRQARIDGYSIVDPEELAERSDDITTLTKNELLELLKQKGLFEKSFVTLNKGKLIEKLMGVETENEGSKGDGDNPTTAAPEQPAQEAEERETDTLPDTPPEPETPERPTGKKRGIFGGN